MKLKRRFYMQDTVRVARELLGAFLVTNLPEGKSVGRIIETEAYLSKNDPASHSFKGKTSRNSPMFGPAGHSYIYFTYGMHYCFNVVTAKKGVGEAVLIRALTSVSGIALMQKRRGTTNLPNLLNGPGKLTRGMGIGKELNGADLTKNIIYITSRDSQKIKIGVSGRVGISKGQKHLLRFFLK